MPYLFLMFFLFFISISGKEFTVDLKNPEYQKGTLSTREGGIISSPEFRVQGKSIAYTHLFDKEQKVHRIVAEGDLMFTTQKQTYVGRRLEYDFITKTGILYDGITAFDLWFLKGEIIRLNENRTLYFSNAFITTSESQYPDWKIQTKEGEISQKNLLCAKKISFRFLDFPIFWLPIFKSNLKTFNRSPVKYRIDWDRGLYPKLSLRYCLYSWEALAVYFRLNIRPSKGIGGALETDYYSFDKRLQFRTRSYLDKDTFYRDTNTKKAQSHYRLQGKYVSKTVNEHMQFLATYDYLSDKTMQIDFEDKDFELKTAKKTQVRIRNYQEKGMMGIDGDFRINAFQGMLQKLPEIFCMSKPFQLGSTGIVSENQIKGGYLSYVSAKDLRETVPEFSSIRLATQHALYRPFYFHGLSITPVLGLEGIFYGDSQKQSPAALTVFTYQLLTDLNLKRSYKTGLHILSPYIHYQGISDPTIDFRTPYIFSIEDGFHRLNVIKLGIRNLFYLKKFPLFEPNIVADLYTYNFLGRSPFKKWTAKVQGIITWNFPSWHLATYLGWNAEKQTVDYANLRVAWTINANFALASELRHRGLFDWRKGDRDNFIMEVTHPISSLRYSPLSDRRNTFLTRLQMKLNPEWIMRLESHMGWGREQKPNYQEAKVQLITTISTSWRLRLTFIHSLTPSQKNNHLTFGLSLIKSRS